MKPRNVLALGALMFAIGGGAVHPFGRVKQGGTALLLHRAEIDKVNLERIRRSCGNCHSEHVQWPWYSYVAPSSWLVESDVARARTELNLSRWSEYTVQERITRLSAMGAVLRAGSMPPRRYTAIHSDAVLSDGDRTTLYEWARNERRRLRAFAPQNQTINLK